MSVLKLDLIFGGLGIFLFGIKYMGDGLKAIAGDRLRDIIDKYTSTPLKGIMIGTVVTLLIQSSSGTTALMISLIRSGLMTLTQAVGIIMGANIGTTITAFIIGLKITNYALYIIGFATIIIVFTKSKKRLTLANTLLGFGCLFYGLKLMDSGLKPIQTLPQFQEFMKYVGVNPILGLLIGLGLTLVIQSSSGVIGIIQLMYAQGSIPLGAALPALFGSNIGTTITAILASIGGSVSAKRAAGIHVMFNVIGSVFFMILLFPFTKLIVFLSNTFNVSPILQIALAHGIFNITMTIVLYPFIGTMVKVIKRIIPGEEFEVDINFDELRNSALLDFPSHAVEVAKLKALQMGEVTLKMLNRTREYINNSNHSLVEKIQHYEETINLIDKKVSHFLTEITQETMTEQDAIDHSKVIQALKDFERIGDHCLNLSEYFENINSSPEKISEGALNDINRMLDLVIEMAQNAIKYLETPSETYATTIESQEEALDKLNHKARQRHIQRVSNKEEVSPLVSSLFVDIISNIERMGDHCSNIARTDLDEA